MSERKPLQGQSVLIVESEMLIGLEVEETILAAGAGTVYLMRKEEAFRFAPEDGYQADLLVIDFRAAEQGTEDVLRLVNAQTPIIVLTTNGEAAITHWVPGNVRIVQKPFSEDDLRGAIDALFH